MSCLAPTDGYYMYCVPIPCHIWLPLVAILYVLCPHSMLFLAPIDSQFYVCMCVGGCVCVGGGWALQYSGGCLLVSVVVLITMCSEWVQCVEGGCSE